MNKLFKIIITGGKTGGHLFPGIAVAQALERLHDNVDVLFVGTNAPFEVQTLEKYGYAHNSIISKPVKGGSILSKAFSISILLVSMIQAMMIMKRIKPDFVLGVGGFSSFAVVLAAWCMGIPTAIQEQNAIPGLTNRLLSKFAKTIFTSFKETKGLVDNAKVKYVGNPVRQTDPVESETSLTSNDFNPDKITLLVTGGSQGAASINKAFMDALAIMDNTDRFNIIHQTGIKDESAIQQQYDDLNIKATVKAFFHNMPQLLKMADLAITRAGAGTVFELCIMGLPAILVPFPHAADDHQTFNAMALEKQDAAIMIKDNELTGQTLEKTIQGLVGNKSRLERMAQMLKRIAITNADEKIATCILKTKEIKV
ncbi:undecaprenyldiphospho-muramoylpentapeptide beta-N-acetylglucosaminyltransferase [Desulfobacula phenolica]|uniref:UDP-N-acetylglucosamine--N-acetylmuramyl-(pentapeptide) pyrophosphoryl-undecaprenol N-acetylglucosamine transferase n=1 Tax=Desulfobacula phenolica TaxID=90732 RepID=A0A1H2DMD4_9BACT|nr:undecaprenyldiphospho-muramoylpentapeptide beta-N-acetylglucosaminyltransferase [Desulfobacula phenolica]SDT84087.1 UDP-N-acetylglucosamine-N-acetylmuramylpentapeptide N-acetylglucosamine transferase [Desulfobacula phenolica]